MSDSFTESMREFDLDLPDGRRLHVYDLGKTGNEVVLWQHGAGMRGVPPEPLVRHAARLGLRIVAFDRPGYSGSTPSPDRSVADGAADAFAVLDSLGLSRVATIGLSAGGMHALACAALAPERIAAAATLCGPAPFGAPGLPWWDGMAEANRAEFEAALTSRSELEARIATASEPNLDAFAVADLPAMSGEYWDWQLSAIDTSSIEGSIEDTMAAVHDWGVDIAGVATPVMVIHGRADSFVPVGHARWVAEACADSRLVLQDGGHISTIPSGELALAWFAAQLLRSA
jgi:pimeloyl-ACP methyl ester carboxylesterase